MRAVAGPSKIPEGRPIVAHHFSGGKIDENMGVPSVRLKSPTPRVVFQPSLRDFYNYSRLASAPSTETEPGPIITSAMQAANKVSGCS